MKLSVVVLLVCLCVVSVHVADAHRAKRTIGSWFKGLFKSEKKASRRPVYYRAPQHGYGPPPPQTYAGPPPVQPAPAYGPPPAVHHAPAYGPPPAVHHAPPPAAYGPPPAVGYGPPPVQHHVAEPIGPPAPAVTPAAPEPAFIAPEPSVSILKDNYSPPVDNYVLPVTNSAQLGYDDPIIQVVYEAIGAPATAVISPPGIAPEPAFIAPEPSVSIIKDNYSPPVDNYVLPVTNYAQLGYHDPIIEIVYDAATSTFDSNRLAIPDGPLEVIYVEYAPDSPLVGASQLGLDFAQYSSRGGLPTDLPAYIRSQLLASGALDDAQIQVIDLQNL